VSVPVTSTNQVVNNASFQQQAVPSSVVPIVSNVLDSSQQSGTTGSILSLPFGKLLTEKQYVFLLLLNYYFS